ncbi:flavodoxin [Clostridium botulinum]|uniref:Flavodoxin n=1 Tax=Clostridium botulinum TaxID=1491 RepID=A0AA43Y477_CLOBO|nr:flavodoxin [Clostridium botulinum]AWB32283.1 flavodoxin [Clostridium botulinum]EGT5614144.1 flavodoxin [Clostridium botulinum]EGT5620845.1 flavodoxin [Clostridium botulinum]EGT5624976.1 flavodoxin [Clostridium botulinum]
MNKIRDSYPSLSLFKITPKTFKDIKTRNTFRENRYLEK